MFIEDRSTVNIGEGAQKWRRESKEHRWTINTVYSVREHWGEEGGASILGSAQPSLPATSPQRKHRKS